MKPVSYSRYLPLTLLLGSLGLAGCGGAISLPDSVSSKSVQGPPVSMKVLGGHAAIVGSHVYLVQPGTSGYGSPAVSLLGNNGATSANGYALTADVNDPNVPVGSKYVTTDSSGNVSFTGAYTCTVGQPVFSYIYGGSSLPTAPTSYTFPTTTTGTTTTTTPTPETVTITGITVAGSSNNGTADTATYTITLGSALPLTANQTVAIAGLTGNLSILNGNQTATAATTGANTTLKLTATADYGSYTYSYRQNGDTHTGTYVETVGNGTYTPTGQNGHDGDNPAGDDGGGDGGHTNATVTSGTASTGTGAFGTGGMATATEPVTTTTPTSTTTYAATTNPVVQLAILGNCPSSGNFSTAGNGAIQFIYSNEVSTVAAAYVFQPFTLASNNNAWDIGTSGSAQALLGIANAANTAAQLYAIQGNAQISGTEDGEGHLANYQTQAGGVPNEGNGVVPQATLDSLANILAACIDATEGTSNSVGAACVKLFQTATQDGLNSASTAYPLPTDTAAAAINIARYPAGNNSGATGTVDTTYVADLNGIPSGTVPYAPSLSTAPNDWTIAIKYPTTAIAGYSAINSGIGRAESVQVDSKGDLWITAQTGYDIVRWSPLGTQNSYYSSADNTTGPTSYIYGYVSIDNGDNAWAGNAACGTPNSNCTGGSSIQEFNNNGVLTSTYGSGYNSAYTVVTNNSGDAFFVANTAGTDVTTGTLIINGNCYLGCKTTDYYQLFEYGPGGAAITGSPFSISPSSISAGNNVAHGAIDAAGDLWLTTEDNPYQIARVTPTGAKVFNAITVNEEQPEFPSIDASGNAWIAVQNEPAEIYKVTPTGGTTILTGGTNGNNATGATLQSTFGSAVDGNGNVWFANRCGDYGTCDSSTGTNSLIEINGTGTNGTANQAISPPQNYIPEAQYPASATSFTPILDDSLNLAIDPSGNLWVTNYIGDSVVEVVGAAAPVVTPLSVAAGTGKLGAKP